MPGMNRLIVPVPERGKAQLASIHMRYHCQGHCALQNGIWWMVTARTSHTGRGI